jgi:DNA-binding transcriptional LysR family regulator
LLLPVTLISKTSCDGESFTRSQLGLLPTEAAAELKSYAKAIGSSAAALKRTAESQGEGVKGTVR